MKANKIIVFLAALIFIGGGCSKKFDSLEQDPNRPVTVPASLVFNGVLNDLNPGAWNQVNRWNQFSNSNYAYYDDQEYNWTGVSFSPYNTVKNIAKMEEEAIRSGADALNPYSALGKFFRAYFFYDLTMKVGDLPMSQALQG